MSDDSNFDFSIAESLFTLANSLCEFLMNSHFIGIVNDAVHLENLMSPLSINDKNLIHSIPNAENFSLVTLKHSL